MINLSWLHSFPLAGLLEQGRQFPVVIDPTITVAGSFGGWQNSSSSPVMTLLFCIHSQQLFQHYFTVLGPSGIFPLYQRDRLS